MFILTTTKEDEEGAFSVSDRTGHRVLYIFEQEDDALRYSMMLDDEGYPETDVLEVEESLLMQVCDMRNYKYSVITSNDIMVPPRERSLMN
tara:strand:+ start:1268 stop:1540 length:273 start_codon:yes stop_codon:yes gene_type:complete